MSSDSVVSDCICDRDEHTPACEAHMARREADRARIRQLRQQLAEVGAPLRTAGGARDPRPAQPLRQQLNTTSGA